MIGSNKASSGNQKSKTFCPLPWIHISTHPEGVLKTCCVANDTIKKKDGSFYNLGHDKIIDIINSEHYIDIRTKMLKGERVAGCEACYKREDDGGQSHRMNYNNSNFYYDNIDKFDSPIVDGKITYFHLPFGNLCNLKCRMCWPLSSTQIEKEVKELKNTDIENFHYGIPFVGYNYWETETFRDNFNSQLNHLDTLWFTGGEPTLIEKNYEILENLVKQNLSKKITLKFNSNMTNINKEFYSLIKEFHSVIFFASVDGFGSMQEYIRYPSKWESIHNNLTKLLNLTNIIVRPVPVIQIANLNYIVDLFEYFESFNRKYKKTIFSIDPNILVYPEILDIKYLPLEFKKQAFEKIGSWYAKSCQYQSTQFRDKILSIRNKCYTDSFDIHKLKDYIKFNNILDNHRQHYLRDVNPELHKLLEQYHD